MRSTPRQWPPGLLVSTVACASTTETMGVMMEMKYELDGNDIKIEAPNGGGAKLVLKMVDKNTIQGPMGIKLIKTQ